MGEKTYTVKLTEKEFETVRGALTLGSVYYPRSVFAGNSERLDRRLARLAPDAPEPVESLAEAYELWGPCVVRDSTGDSNGWDLYEISVDGLYARCFARHGSAHLSYWDEVGPFTLVERFTEPYTITEERVVRHVTRRRADGGWEASSA